MVLILRAYRVMKSKTGILRYQQYKIMHKWTNEQVEELPFDIFSPQQWRKYLLNDFRTKNNKLLQNETKEGEMLRYNVYFWGAKKYIKEHFGLEGKHGYFISLFPGMDKENKQFDIIKYGYLQKILPNKRENQPSQNTSKYLPEPDLSRY